MASNAQISGVEKDVLLSSAFVGVVRKNERWTTDKRVAPCVPVVWLNPLRNLIKNTSPVRGFILLVGEAARLLSRNTNKGET